MYPILFRILTAGSTDKEANDTQLYCSFLVKA